jgi:hypothetical protein
MSSTNIPLHLIGAAGEPFGRLRVSALELVSEAEDVARRRNLAKSTSLSNVLKEQVDAAGYQVTEPALAEAVLMFNRLRRGDAVSSVSIIVTPKFDSQPATVPSRSGYPLTDSPRSTNGAAPLMPDPQTSTPNTAISFFEAERTFPNDDAAAWYNRLVGLDAHKERLLLELEMLLFPEQVATWSKEHHGGQILQLCNLYRNRVPLILFEGDVGTGKTALAETVGDALARRMGGNMKVHLLKLNTQVRGSGHVGEMSDLIAQAFAQAEGRAKALRGQPVLLLIDEADALAASRDTQQMHHEDKAGLNTVLQRLDNLRSTRLPIAALFITNRPEALDPAIRRRAGLDLRFERPSDAIRHAIIASSVPEIAITKAQQDEIIKLTGPKEPKNKGVGFTSSDLTDRLLPNALRQAYTDGRALVAQDIVSQAHEIEATPKFGAAT